MKFNEFLFDDSFLPFVNLECKITIHFDFIEMVNFAQKIINRIRRGVSFTARSKGEKAAESVQVGEKLM